MVAFAYCKFMCCLTDVDVYRMTKDWLNFMTPVQIDDAAFEVGLEVNGLNPHIA